MGIGISQEIFNETYQRPLILNKETQAGTKSWLRERISTGAARISWERICCRWRSLSRILAECQCPLPMPDHLIRGYAKVLLRGASNKALLLNLSKAFVYALTS